MPDTLRDQLQHALGADYEIERELEGGAMSRVFLARELALDRHVVIKVLPPELAAEISADRCAAPPTSPAIIYANIGQADSAVAWLQRAYEARSLDDRIVNNVWCAPLRTHPGFRALVRRMGI